MAAARSHSPITHERPAEGEAQELLGLERVLFWLRVVGLAFVVSQAPAYTLASPLLIAAVVLLTGGTALAQRATLRDDLPLATIRRRGILFLVSDLVAVYVVGTAFVPDPAWVGFYFYPLMALEATLVAGIAAGVAVTALSVLVYLAQLVLHVSYGNTVEARTISADIALLVMTGGFMSAFGWLADRGRRDLRVLLDLTSALAHRRDEGETIELLDRRLNDAVGGRVRALVLRDANGRFGVLRWQATEQWELDRRTIEGSLGDLESLAARFIAGRSTTYQVDSWSVIVSELRLPEWTRAVSLVPIFHEARWVGILPVLWPSPHVPAQHQLRLLYGLANQVGLALAQGPPQPGEDETVTCLFAPDEGAEPA